MPFVYACPHCGTQTKVDDEYAGRSGRCVSCNRSITLPAAAEIPAIDAAADGGGGANRVMRWVVAVVVVGVLGLGGLITVVRVGGRKM